MVGWDKTYAAGPADRDRKDNRICGHYGSLCPPGERILILAHRGELLEQAADKIRKSTGLNCAVEKADQTCRGSFYRIVVGSVQTLMRDRRLSGFPKDYFQTIVIDEAHHCISDSYQKVLQYFSGAKVLGVTATPDRGDMRDLGEYFENIAYEYPLPKAIKEGFLSPIKALTVPLKINISQVGMQGGDFKSGELGTALDPYLEQIAVEMEKYCQNRKTVVFLPLVKTSQKFRDILNAHGFYAAEVNGNSEDRAEILADFDQGSYKRPMQLHAPYGGVGLPIRGLRHCAAADKGPRPLLPDGGARHAAIPGERPPAVIRFPLDDRAP